MKITKYEHACFTVEHEGKVLVIDPGVYTTNLTVPENVVGVIVTHEHPDHFDVAALGAIVAHNPEAAIIAHQHITRQFGISGETLPYKTVDVGDTVTVGPFNLAFYGGEHAVIHADMPRVANLGVMINDKIFYPGDSYVEPKKEVDVLALPVSAPWLKISESIEYLLSVKPRIVFPTHDAILSPTGKALPDGIIPPFAEQIGAKYQRIDDAPIEI